MYHCFNPHPLTSATPYLSTVICDTADGQSPLHIAMDRGEETIIQQLLTRKADPNMKDLLGNTSLHLAVQLKQAKELNFLKYNLSVRASICVEDRCHIPASHQQCHIETLHTIIDNGVDVNAVNNRDQTALWFACCDGQMDFVKILLDKGANPNLADENGDSSLHAAIYGCCSPETIQEIIDHDAQVNAVNKDGASPLLLACSSAQKESVKLLLKAKADPNIAYVDGDTSLHVAVAADCSKDTLQEIIDCGTDVNAVNKRGRTPLLLGCFYRQTDAVKVLIEAGADPTIDDKEGFSCLHAAVDGICSKDTLQTLIDHGAHINAIRKDGTNALLRACRTGQSDSVRFLLEAGADVNMVKPDENTSLHEAIAGHCSKETQQNIIEHGVNVNAVNNGNETALITACASAQTESIKLLLKMGADPNISNVDGFTSLHAAVCGHCTNEILQDIITHAAYLNTQNILGETALIMACFYRQQDSVKFLVEAGSYPNLADNNGNTSLHAAVLGGCRKKIIQILIDHGADVNTTNKNRETALLLACEERHVGAMNVLLKRGANPNITGDDGNTCLHNVVTYECSNDALQALIDHGANVNATNHKNQTALMIACLKGTVDVLHILLKAGADPNIIDIYSNTCIHDVVTLRYGDEVLQTIINHGADVEATNKENETALMLACYDGNVAAVSILLNAGAEPSITDKSGHTCLHKAVWLDCNKEIIQAIIDHGADVNATNKMDQTSLMIACLDGNADAIKLLLNAGTELNIRDKYGNTCLHNVF